MLRIAMNKNSSQHPNGQYKKQASLLYTTQQVLTKSHLNGGKLSGRFQVTHRTNCLIDLKYCRPASINDRGPGRSAV